ncbi:MAG: DUF479 domain-containing protein [Chitinophagaceae bacterium]|nr:MAG: DUF479 domain-containing protein [Chitinophagaceae bacterium]
MNFLAHAVLSFDEPEILFGQMISDFVKGSRRFSYPPMIGHGIMLHRHIDSFTDAHDTTRRARDLFRPVYRLYSGAFVDISFDHFVATDNREFGPRSLFTFSQQVYSHLDRLTDMMPAGFAGMYPYMKKDNWLLGYAEPEGIYRSFRGLVQRSAYMTDSKPAAELFEKHFVELRACYEAFWPELKAFAREESDRYRF